MASTSPTRPSRKAAVRKHIVADDSDDQSLERPHVTSPGDDEEGAEFTPAPVRKSPKKVTRRGQDVPKKVGRPKKPQPMESVESSHVLSPDQCIATNASELPRKAGRPRKARTTGPTESVETTQLFNAEQSVVTGFLSPTKTASPRKPKTITSIRKPRMSNVSQVTALPTPQASTSPEPLMAQARPLGDITEETINKFSPPNSQMEFTKVKPLDTVLERPMDIVVRTRALEVPQTQQPPSPKARTVIKYLVLNNFKSYAGRQEVGPFHASFSSVVGPNGSGKSNVIDSLLFVFGFRASKMRQGKISALIHNSAAHPDLDFCEVEVHFQEVNDLPNGQHEVVPNSTLIISRRAFKNNSSKYYLNMRESNFTAVTTLLKDKGVDLDHKRFLILQGEVESIAQMKPKAANEHDDGLLEYLEDIIGTSKYKTPIEESATEVETLNEVCMEKSARVQHVEKEKYGLEDKKNRALAYIKDENELAYKQSALYQVYIDECNDNLKVTEEAVAQTQAKLDEELDKHQGNEDEIKALEKGCKRAQKDYEALEKDTQGVLKEMAKFEKEKVKLEEKKKFLATKQKKLEKALQTSRLAASEASSLTEKFQDDIERNEAETIELEQSMKIEIKELAAIRESLKGKTQAFSDQIAVKQKSLEPWNEKMNQKQSTIAVAQSELDMLKERASEAEVALQDAQSRITAIQGTQQAKIVELEQAKAERIQLEKDAKRLHHELAKVSQKEPELRTQLSGARQKADEARASLSSTQSQGNVLTGLMRLKESGRIEGFHGRLGNLGTIDQKYDVAISTACAALENLVVDTVEVGQQCIDYLRKNNLGRANIILLDRLAKRDLTTIQTPEHVPRLFDLVKAKDDKFRPAFYSVLQNTLVAENLEQANRIAYGARRWRVVTLDGQLIDVSGTMSGGGTRVARGGMSSRLVSQTTKEQVSKLEVDRDALEQQFQETQERQRELESETKIVEEKIPAVEIRIQKIELEIGSTSKNIADAERRIAELSTEKGPSKSDSAQITALEKQVAQLEKELTKLHSQTAGVEQEIKDLQDKIMEVGGVKLRSQKAKVDSLKEQIDRLGEETSNAEVSKSKAQKDKIKHEKAYTQAQQDIDSTEEELRQLETEVGNQKIDAAGIKRQAEEAEQALESKKEELETLKASLSSRQDQLTSTRALEIDMRNKLEENQKVLLENQKRLRYWTDKLSKLTVTSTTDLDSQTSEEDGAPDFPTYTKDELLDMDKETLKAEIAVLEESTQKANVDLSVLAEYRRRVEEHATRQLDLNTAVVSRDTAKKRCDELRRLRLEGFMEGFSTISLRLKEMYQMITMGGNAELELVDSLDPFSEGILFSVMPPKKSWKNISNLSGGEKTLSSLALVFALHHYKPTPLYVMDEIDAALDFRNVSIVASYIKERTKNAQFIVISLRNNMFELASRLVGVYKVNHMTKSVTVENKDYIQRRS